MLILTAICSYAELIYHVIVLRQFCLSALHPNEWQQAVKNVWTMLKPGGILCLRDYGRNDLTQLRFKAARLME